MHAIRCASNKAGVVPPSVEVFRAWENNSDSIQFTDWWHYTAVTNRHSSKADIGTGDLYTNCLKMLCGLSLHNTKADCSRKVLAGVLSPVNSSVACRKIACVLSLRASSKCRVRTNTFLFIWCHLCCNTRVICLRSTTKTACHKGWN